MDEQEERIICPGLEEADIDIETSLRPRTLDQYIGQEKVKDKIYDLKTKLIMPFIANDIICAIAILDTLNVLDMSKFLKFIENSQLLSKSFKPINIKYCIFCFI